MGLGGDGVVGDCGYFGGGCHVGGCGVGHFGGLVWFGLLVLEVLLLSCGCVVAFGFFAMSSVLDEKQEGMDGADRGGNFIGE